MKDEEKKLLKDYAQSIQNILWQMEGSFYWGELEEKPKEDQLYPVCPICEAMKKEQLTRIIEEYNKPKLPEKLDGSNISYTTTYLHDKINAIIRYLKEKE